MTGPRTSNNGQIQRRDPDKGQTLVTLLQRMGPEIARALPRHMTPDRMARITMTALRTTRDLARCSPESFLGCVMQAAQLGLEPNTPLGHLYLIPRNMKDASGGRSWQCTMIIGYQGMIDLARRSGLVSSIFAHGVRLGDEFSYHLGLHPDIRHVPSEAPDREERELTHVYAVAHPKEGAPIFEVLPKAKIEARRSRSATASKSFSPWQSDYEAMALKTGIRALWKWLPKSTEMARAIAIDEAPELGKPQAALFDPTVTDALVRHGLRAENAAAAEAEEAEIVDPETGEVSEPGAHDEPDPSDEGGLS